MIAADLVLDRPDLVGRSAPGRTGSRSAGSPGVTSEPAWRARSPTTLRKARWSRCVPVWLRIVWARRSASTTASTVSPTRAGRAACRGGRSAAARLWVSVDREELAAAARSRRRPGHRPGRRPRRRTASGRGRPRRRRAGQLVELHPVADDRDAARRPSSSRSQGSRVAGPRLDRPGRAPPARRASELGLLAGPAPVALLGERCLEPGAVDRDAVLGGELDGQVDREAKRVVEAEREVAGSTARPRQVLRAAADRRARRPGRAGESAASSGRVPASSVRPNWASSRSIAARIASRRSTRYGIGLGHHLDDDLGHSARNGSRRPSRRPWRTARRTIRRRT